MTLETLSSIDRNLQRLRSVGMPDEMWAEAERGLCLSAEPAVNTHIHLPPNFSAFERMEQAVHLAARQDVKLLGASNYYDYSIYPSFAALALASGIYPLFGLEILCLLEDLKRAGILVNDPANPGRMYLCGKGITRFGAMTAEAARLLGIMRRNDEWRIRKMIRLLSEVFEQRGLAVGLDPEMVLERVVRRHGVAQETVTLQERHVAQVFQQELFRLVPEAGRPAALARILAVPSQDVPQDEVRIQNAIRAHLMKIGKPAFVEESFLSFQEARRLILELGGIPCYPTLADGTSPVCAHEDPPEKLIGTLLAQRIFCAEFIPLRNEPQVLQRYVHTMRSAGLVVTAGTEHNTLDLVAMSPRCVRCLPVPASVREIFVEGAYVVVAHQYLQLHGRCGYVDDRGELNPAFASTEERIARFRRLGAAVVARQLAAQSP
jgi:hypothetical protein